MWTWGPQHQMFQFYKSISTVLNYLLIWADLCACCSFSNSCPLKLADTEETWPMDRTEGKLGWCSHILFEYSCKCCWTFHCHSTNITQKTFQTQNSLVWGLKLLLTDAFASSSKSPYPNYVSVAATRYFQDLCVRQDYLGRPSLWILPLFSKCPPFFWHCYL